MSKSISDVIEEFIMSSLDDDEYIELSRNDLAKFFSCVPSQINYVLNTRFTLNRGFVVESQRGGGGYIKVLRLNDNNDNFLKNVLVSCHEPKSALEGNQLIEQICKRGLLTVEESDLIKSMISPKALNNPINMDGVLRANIISQLVIELMKEKRSVKYEM